MAKTIGTERFVPYRITEDHEKEGEHPGNDTCRYNSTTSQCLQGNRGCFSKKLLYNGYNIRKSGVLEWRSNGVPAKRRCRANAGWRVRLAPDWSGMVRIGLDFRRSIRSKPESRLVVGLDWSG